MPCFTEISAVYWLVLEGKSYQQAAQELGCPAGTLSARLYAAREKLRRRLTARDRSGGGAGTVGGGA